MATFYDSRLKVYAACWRTSRTLLDKIDDKFDEYFEWQCENRLNTFFTLLPFGIWQATTSAALALILGFPIAAFAYTFTRAFDGIPVIRLPLVIFVAGYYAYIVLGQVDLKMLWPF